MVQMLNLCYIICILHGFIYSHMNSIEPPFFFLVGYSHKPPILYTIQLFYSDKPSYQFDIVILMVYSLQLP